MSDASTNLSLPLATGSDNSRDYLKTGLRGALVILDALFNFTTGHDHSGAGKGAPVVASSLAAGSATGAALGSDVMTLTGAQVGTNKTFTAPVINTSLTGTAVGSGASQVAAGNHTHTASGLVRIAETLLGSANAAIDFSSIPATYRHLKLVIQGRSSAGSDIGVLLQFNGDTGANYDHQQVQAVATTVAASENIASTTAIIGYLSSLANVGDQIELTIANYALTTLHKSGRSSAAHKDVASSGNVYVGEHSIFWRSTAAINAIHLALASGNFEVGTVATLYGMSQ